MRLLKSSLPGLASRTHVESLGKPCDLISVLKALPCKLDIEIYSPSILYKSDYVSEISGSTVAECLDKLEIKIHLPSILSLYMMAYVSEIHKAVLYGPAHVILKLIKFAQKPPFNAHANVCSSSRGPNF